VTNRGQCLTRIITIAEIKEFFDALFEELPEELRGVPYFERFPGPLSKELSRFVLLNVGF
jgi:hypothetical protein